MSASVVGPRATSNVYNVVISILLILLGILAIVLPLEAGLAIAVIVGWLFVFGGIIYLIHAFSTRGAAHAIWHGIVGVFFIIGGIYMLLHPAISLLTLTLWLAILFFIEAIFEIVAYFSSRSGAGSGWMLANGIITLILAFLIWRHWPSSAAWAIGTLVGVSLIISGFTRLMHGSSMRRSVLLPI